MTTDAEFQSWMAKAVDETLAVIHGAPAEIAPLATPFTAGDLPRAVAAMIERVGRIIRERDNARNYAEGTDRLIREARAERDFAEQQALGLAETLRAEREQLPVLAVDTPVMLADDETRYRVHRYWPWGTDGRESVMVRLLPIEPEAR